MAPRKKPPFHHAGSRKEVRNETTACFCVGICGSQQTRIYHAAAQRQGLNLHTTATPNNASGQKLQSIITKNSPIQSSSVSLNFIFGLRRGWVRALPILTGKSEICGMGINAVGPPRYRPGPGGFPAISASSPRISSMASFSRFMPSPSSSPGPLTLAATSTNLA
jgi:hypothetical protein